MYVFVTFVFSSIASQNMSSIDYSKWDDLSSGSGRSDGDVPNASGSADSGDDSSCGSGGSDDDLPTGSDGSDDVCGKSRRPTHTMSTIGAPAERPSGKMPKFADAVITLLWVLRSAADGGHGADDLGSYWDDDRVRLTSYTLPEDLMAIALNDVFDRTNQLRDVLALMQNKAPWVCQKLIPFVCLFTRRSVKMRKVLLLQIADVLACLDRAMQSTSMYSDERDVYSIVENLTYLRGQPKGFISFGAEAGGFVKLLCIPVARYTEATGNLAYNTAAFLIILIGDLLTRTNLDDFSPKDRSSFIVALREYALPLAKQMIQVDPFPDCCWMSGEEADALLVDGYHVYSNMGLSRQEYWDSAKIVKANSISKYGYAAVYGHSCMIHKMLNFLHMLHIWTAFKPSDVDSSLLNALLRLCKARQAPQPAIDACARYLGNWKRKVKEPKASLRQGLVSNPATMPDHTFAQYQASKCGNQKCNALEPATGHFKFCSVCRRERYCSPECQKAAWKMHKKVCKADA
eukprot:TRINITY_DN42177_c0_g1_i1.p1 TRINITY_DN42177_c0_g1~~TRINITY_DN42177_c0_g1_i1.p1  ORF type:complete len:516 (-),score=45.80 TRINITY_DN42177_c0_g1_i1:90-1637(-)